MALAELHESHQVTDRERLLHQGGQHPGSRDRDIHSPGIVEEPFVAGVVDPGHHSRDRELRLGQQGQHHVGLIVAGCGDHHVELLQVHLFEEAQLAGIAEAPVHGRNRVDVDVVGVALDQRHIVGVLHQFPGDRTSDGTRPGDGDFHSPTPSPGG